MKSVILEDILIKVLLFLLGSGFYLMLNKFLPYLLSDVSTIDYLVACVMGIYWAYSYSDIFDDEEEDE